jgi:hypothetical protein
MSDEYQDEITLEMVKAFFEANKEKPEVDEYIKSMSIEKPLSSEVVNGFLETIEGKNLLQPKLDAFATKAITSHDEKNKEKVNAEVARRVNEKLAELNKEDTPEQKMLKEQIQRTQDLEKRYEEDKKLAKINEIAYKEGIDPAFVGGLKFDSAEEFGLYANRFKDYVKKEKEKTINEFVASNSYKPNGSKGQDKEKLDLSNLSVEKLIELEEEGKLDTELVS